MRTLIEEDLNLVDRLVRQAAQFKPLFNKVLAAYNELNLGKFTGETWDSIKRNGAEEINRAYQDRLNEDLKHLKTPMLQRNAIELATEPVASFEETIRELRAFEPRSGRDDNKAIDISDLSFVDGELVINEEDRELLAEKYARVYLESDPDSQEVWELAKTLAETVGKLYQKAEEAKLGVPLNWHSLLGLGAFVQGEKTEWKPNIRTSNLVAKGLRDQRNRQ